MWWYDRAWEWWRGTTIICLFNGERDAAFREFIALTEAQLRYRDWQGSSWRPSELRREETS